MKKIISVALAAGVGFAYSIMPYGAYINYSSKSVKDKGYIGGIYGSVYKAPFKFELDGEHTKIKYKNNLKNWNQTDLTALVHFYKGYNYEFKIGIHNIWSKQYNKEFDKIFIGGIQYYKYLKHNYGTDIYYSVYKNFRVYQISPYIGFNFGNYYSEIGSFYFQTKLNHIHINKSNVSNKQTYNDIDLKISNYKGPYTTTLKATFGKSTYKVANSGFVVYNLGDETKYNYGIDINYAINKQSSFKVGFYRNKLQEQNTNTDYYSNIFTLSYLRAF